MADLVNVVVNFMKVQSVLLHVQHICHLSVGSVAFLVAVTVKLVQNGIFTTLVTASTE